MRYEEFYRRSIEQPEEFWGEQARAIHWNKQPERILDYSNPPFRKWFVGGETNLCFNAVDRHLDERGDQLALVAISSETGTTREITYRELHREVNTFAAAIRSLGVGRGDRVVIYMPNMAEAVFAMLACARIGAVHSVVFGGFAAHNLALRIDDAQPRLLICADAGMRGGKVIAYKPLVDAACEEAATPPPHVLVVSRGLDPEHSRGRRSRRRTYAPAARRGSTARQSTWSGWNPTSPAACPTPPGTTGKPKGVQRDVGGYAVALALSMWSIYDVRAAGQVMFSTSDVGCGRGAFVQRVRAADRRRDVGAVRGPARRIPIAGVWWTHLRAVRRAHGVLLAHRHPRAEEAGRVVPAEARPVGAAVAVPGGRTAGRTDGAAGSLDGIGKTIIDNCWQSRNRVAGAVADAGAGPEAGEVPVRPACRRPATSCA